MALADAYATVAEYRDRVGDQTAGDSATLTAQLLAASRLTERELGRVFNKTAAGVARYFRGSGDDLIYVNDLVSIATNGIAIDTDLDGDYDDVLMDSTSAWVSLEPSSAAEFGEPYTAIRLLPLTSNSTLTWLPYERNIRITGVWGWPDVPGVIKELVIDRVHELRLAHLGGPMQQLPTFDENTPLNSNAWRTWRDIKQNYGKKTLVTA